VICAKPLRLLSSVLCLAVLCLRRKRSRNGSPTKNPILTGSTVPGILMSLTQTGSTRRRHGKHLKSIWTTAAPWFSNTPKDPDRLAEKLPPKEILAKRSGEPRSPQMKPAVNPSDTAKSRRPAEHSSFQRFSFQHFSFTQTPFSPATPISPPSSLRQGYDRQAGPSQWLFQKAPAKSKFLATNPHFPALRSVPMAVSEGSRQKQIPSNPTR
jgi:hypothetical protein